MALLDEADLITAAASSESIVASGRHPTSPRGGKRPRTTSSIFAAAATGMLMGPKPAGGSPELPSPVAKSENTGPDDHQPEALFQLRRHLESGRAALSVADVDNLGKPSRKAPSVGRSAVDSHNVAMFSRSIESLKLGRFSSSREDAFGEAEAMAADEGRISPPSPLRTRSLDHLRPSEARRTPSSRQRIIGEANEPERSFDAIPLRVSERKYVDVHPAIAAAPTNILLMRDDRNGSAPTAPAYEPPPRNTRETATGDQHEEAPEAWSNNMPSTKVEMGHEQWNDSTTPCGISAPRVLRHDISSRITRVPTPPSNRQEGIDSSICQEEGKQEEVGAISSMEMSTPQSREFDRKHFLSAAMESDVSYKSVRDDLLQYMEGVRARTSEDGTPSVTFPGNFDRIVGLMGRKDLEDRSPGRDVKGAERIGNRGGTTRDESSGVGNQGEGKGRGKERGDGERVRPWTKYLLEEGLDRTEAFSRYRGIFADEQTGEDRFMRGLAKMRELDLRLARVTGRARELKLLARDAADQAERAAVGVVSSVREQGAFFRPKGRGPVAIEDASANRPPLRLPLPLAAESARFGPMSSRASNTSARRTDADSGNDDKTSALRTERSEISATSGSQRDSEGGGGTNKQDGRARGGRAFVTQNFRGSGRRGPSSNMASAVVSEDSNHGIAGRQAATGSGRGKNKFSRQEGGTSSRSDGGVSARSNSSSGGVGGGSGAGESGGGSSGVSFVLRNKRHAARAGRRRLTDEQESLVSRFLEDADGFNDNGDPTGEEPSGVWAEIIPYGGVGASQDAARLAAINARLLEMGGVLLSDEEEKGDERGQPPSPKNTSSENASPSLENGVGEEVPPPPSPPPPPSSRSRLTMEGVAGDGIAPGDAALREQRAMREARCRERAIDAALEQLRDSLFESSAAGSHDLREKAVDTALEQARSAPLNMQRGVRQGAGRIDSLLGGKGPQPVGEWEVKHALRQGEEEFRGKELASRQRIEELLITVRQESAADSRCADNPPPEGSDTIDTNRFRRGASLDAFFSLTDGRGASDLENDSRLNGVPGKNVPPLVTDSDSAATTRTPRAILPLEGAALEGSASGRGDGGKGKQGEDNDAAGSACVGRHLVGGMGATPTESPTEKWRLPPQTDAEKSQATTLKSTASAETETPVGSAPLPRPRVARKKKPSATIPPELVQLFRAPLLVPRHLDPPIAGIAAAAVASGGARRVKPATGAVITG